MFGFAVKTRQNEAESPRSPNSARSDLSVGEIDTRAPFQSVKAAVSLFGEVGSARSAPVTKKSNTEERVLEKETQHHMILRELDYYKEQLKTAETTKVQALRDLQRANRTLQQLTNKLETLSESKQASIKATEAAKTRAKELEEQLSLRAQLGSDAWKFDLDNERESYKNCTGELIASKQELANFRQDFDAALEAKLAVFQKAEDAQHTAQLNQEKHRELEKDVAALRQTLDQVRADLLRAEEEHSRIVGEKEGVLQTRKSAKEEVERAIERLREEYEPSESLERKLEETNEAIKVMQEQLNGVRSSNVYLLKAMGSELESTQRVLEEIVAEENSLRGSVGSMKLQLEEAKREHVEMEGKALEAENIVEQMQADLEKKKSELEEAMAGCSSSVQLSIEKLLAEGVQARCEAEDIKKNVEVLKQQADTARIADKETEEKLKVALKEAEEAKVAEKLADGRVYNHQRNEASELEGAGPIGKIRLRVEEFEAMKKKIEECRNQADLKVATAMAQVETINASEREILQKLEGVLKENETIQSEMADAIKTTEMAEAAKRVVEGELQKWRKNEQKVGKPSKRSVAK